MKKQLFIVPIFDTEGPSAGKDDLHDNWNELSSGIKNLSKTTRFDLEDFSGNPMIFNWFIMDWIGYSSDDPEFKRRKLEVGYNGVYNKYIKNVLNDESFKRDKIYWHYHHPTKDGSWGWNNDWNDSKWYENILNNKIFENEYFPSVYRSGKYVQNDDQSKWLEKWIPFDYSNNSPAKTEFCDWSQASTSWLPYRSNFNNYQIAGNMNRYIFRCLPVFAKGGSNKLTKKDVELAFESADRGESPILAFSTHDYYKSAEEEFKTAYSFIKEVEQKYPDIEWTYWNALDAIRKSVDLDYLPELFFGISKRKGNFELESNHRIFGEIPYVVIEYMEGLKHRIDVEAVEENKWIFNLKDNNVKRIGVAANDSFGNTGIKIINL